jgi:excisionase family DNA binding protein
MELLTVQETAALLKVNPITIRRYIADGRLPAVRVGKGLRVRRDAVGQFLTEVPPKPPRSTGGPSPNRQRLFTRQDSLWDIVGIARSEDQGSVAEHKQQYLAETYMPKTT